MSLYGRPRLGITYDRTLSVPIKTEQLDQLAREADEMGYTSLSRYVRERLGIEKTPRYLRTARERITPCP